MRAVLIQLQVIHAILLREVKTRYGDQKLGYAWALISPMIQSATFVAFHYGIGGMAPPGVSPIAFIVIGITTFDFFQRTNGQTVSSIAANKGLLFYPQVRPLDLVISRTLLEGATQFVVFSILMTIASLADGWNGFNSVLTIIAGLGLALGLGGSFGLVMCGLISLFPTIERLQSVILRPLFFLSAIFYPLDSVPPVLQHILLYNPIVHTIELVRVGWFPGFQSRHIDPWYPVAWIVVLLFFGLSLERAARRRFQLS